MSDKNRLSRRTLLQTALIVTPVAMTGCATLTRENEPLLRATAPVARSLAYYPDTRDVPADNPLATNHDVNQKCANCLHARGTAGRGRLECPMFPGRSVKVDGWCTLWAQG